MKRNDELKYERSKEDTMSNRQTLRKAIAGVLKQTLASNVPSKQKESNTPSHPKRGGESA
jgi:hypothetical protein